MRCLGHELTTCQFLKEQSAHRRHDIKDAIRALLEPRLSGRKGTWGGIAHDNRTFINAVFWILRTGAPWRDLPPDYGDWKNTHRRFCRWRDKGQWETTAHMANLIPFRNKIMNNMSIITGDDYGQTSKRKGMYRSSTQAA